MDKFLGFKTEEILTCLLLVVVGYFIAKIFSRSCGNGFSVGGAYGGSDCGGLYDPNDNTTYCSFRNDASLKYKCNTSPVCNSFTKNGCNGPDSLCCNDPDSPYFGLQKEKCPSMNQPTRLKKSGRGRDNLQHFCGNNPKYLSNNRDLIISGGDTIRGPPDYGLDGSDIWEGSDRCWSTSIIPQPPAPAPPAPDSCSTPAELITHEQLVNDDCDMSDPHNCVARPGVTTNVCKATFENYYTKCWPYIESSWIERNENVGLYQNIPACANSLKIPVIAPAPAPSEPQPAAPTSLGARPPLTTDACNDIYVDNLVTNTPDTAGDDFINACIDPTIPSYLTTQGEGKWEDIYKPGVFNCMGNTQDVSDCRQQILNWTNTCKHLVNVGLGTSPTYLGQTHYDVMKELLEMPGCNCNVGQDDNDDYICK